ncbi:uncharacterized protein LOC118410273 [Branchiostoma floridae]|uniref:Uncharacterized protein LOC118410273 n=1 Tax=Branchiostoma floridae TaxID=7739 RepID=A0A9J7KPN0_BRAFL|nr:uncharacterized protein LOC118410273 [Branchiostoma floridae]
MGQVRYHRLCPLLILTMAAVCVMMVASMQDPEMDSKEIQNVGAAIRRAAESVQKARSDIKEAERAIEKSGLPEELSAAFRVVLREKVEEELGTGHHNTGQIGKTDSILVEQLLKLVPEHSEGYASQDTRTHPGLLMTVCDLVKTVLLVPVHMVAFIVWRVGQFLCWCLDNFMASPVFVYKTLQWIKWFGATVISVLIKSVALLVSLIYVLIAFVLYTVYSAVAFVFSTLWMLLYGMCSIIMIPIHILILSSPLLFMYLINQPDANHIVRWLQETARSVQTFIRDMFVEYQSRQQPLPNPSVQASPLGFTAYPTVSSAPRTEVPADAEGWEFHEHLLQPRRSGRLSSLRRHFFIEDTENDNSCVVCLDRPANMTLRPCGHRCVCRRCAWRILNPRVGEDGGKCPLDRQPIFVAVPDRICVIM